MEFTGHARFDRAARIRYIVNTIGVGNVVKEHKQENYMGEQWACLTDTGVMIIKDLAREKVITMFVATLSQAMKVYQSRRLPNEIYNTVRGNYEIWKNQPI